MKFAFKVVDDNEVNLDYESTGCVSINLSFFEYEECFSNVMGRTFVVRELT